MRCNFTFILDAVNPVIVATSSIVFLSYKEQDDRPLIGWQLGEGGIEHLYLVGAVCPV